MQGRHQRWLFGFTLNSGLLDRYPVGLEMQLQRKWGLYIQALKVSTPGGVAASRFHGVSTHTHLGSHVYTISGRKHIRESKWAPAADRYREPQAWCVSYEDALSRLSATMQHTPADVHKLTEASVYVGRRLPAVLAASDFRERNPGIVHCLTPRIILQVISASGSDVHPGAYDTRLVGQWSWSEQFDCLVEDTLE
ncbi:hypothetical protein DIPPA_01799 [Diplonema papillatum]|nr:hypothetical protein DIPPA_01799 [Diplonema papillatum]